MKKFLLFKLFTLTLFITPFLKAVPIEPVQTMEIPFASAQPAMDGIAEDWYGEVQTTYVFNASGYEGEADFNLSFQTCWDMDYLYLICYVLDDIEHDYEWFVGNQWEFDAFDVFLQLDTNTVTTSYGSTTTQLRICRGLDSVESPGRADREDFLYYMESSAAGGWIAEIGIPWTCVMQDGAMPEDFQDYVNSAIGFDVMGADSDNSDGDYAVGNRDVQSAWDADDPSDEYDRTEDLAWNNTSVFGYVTLATGQVNPRPVADAGPDQYVEEGVEVTLDGSGSFDPEGETISYSWTSPTGITLSDNHSATPSFTTPHYMSNKVLSFGLTVNDGHSNSFTDIVGIHVIHDNLHPVADAGPDQTVRERGLVILDGSGSSDPEGRSVSYTWSSDLELDMVYRETAHPLLVAPEVFEDQTIPVYLKVNDGIDDSPLDTMYLNVSSLGDLYDTLVVYDTVYMVDVVTNNNTILISVVGPDDEVLTREVEGVLYVELYPNPADQYIRIKSDEEILTIGIYNMGGILLTEEIINDVSAELNLGGFATGNYVLKLTTASGEVSKQFVLE
ncbi:MAG: T9SS type A sorting domain-containing protein [Bacteroidales bacterium]|nr:T9SS type A sorting domain-containing protein [Bacteroidales bacterium]